MELKYINKKVAFQTLGCKLNFSETSTIARDFTDKAINGLILMNMQMFM